MQYLWTFPIFKRTRGKVEMNLKDELLLNKNYSQSKTRPFEIPRKQPRRQCISQRATSCRKISSLGSQSFPEPPLKMGKWSKNKMATSPWNKTNYIKRSIRILVPVCAKNVQGVRKVWVHGFKNTYFLEDNNFSQF